MGFIFLKSLSIRPQKQFKNPTGQNRGSPGFQVNYPLQNQDYFFLPPLTTT